MTATDSFISEQAEAIALAEALDMLVAASRAGDQPASLLDAAQAACARLIGHKMLTVMLFDAERVEVERIYTTMPAVYPVGGRKKKALTPWGEHVLNQRRVYRAENFEGIRSMFDDHETLASLGIASMLNIPIAYDGKCIGTMNLSHEQGWFKPEHERLGLLIGAFLSTPLALLQQQKA